MGCFHYKKVCLECRDTIDQCRYFPKEKMTIVGICESCKGKMEKNKMEGRVIPPKHFVENIAVNVDNKKLSDAEFRQFIRNTLPIVIYDRKQG